MAVLDRVEEADSRDGRLGASDRSAQLPAPLSEHAPLMRRFRLREVLYRDAVGARTLVRDRETGEPVGLELFVVPGLASQREAVLRASELAYQLDSPHATRVTCVQGLYPGGVAGDGSAGYLVRRVESGVEYQDGRALMSSPLSSTPARGPQEAVRFGIEIARGLHAAHSLGLFHLGLCPELCFVRPVTRRLQISGFGMGHLRAHALSWNEAAGAGCTGEGALPAAGMHPYLAPEQVEPGGVGGESDALRRVDVYGAGALLYHQLTGRSPLPECPGQALSCSNVRQAERIPLTSRRRIWDGRALPARLGRIVDRALAVNPADRYATCDELARDLWAYLRGRPASVDAHRPALRAWLSAVRGARRVLPGARVAMVAGAMVWGYRACGDVAVQQTQLRAARDQFRAISATKAGGGGKFPGSSSQAASEGATLVQQTGFLSSEAGRPGSAPDQ